MSLIFEFLCINYLNQNELSIHLSVNFDLNSLNVLFQTVIITVKG
jgi:hypothetical protein